ncbi:MAG: NDP-hexose 2,3-dehydratase family protein [Acidobacteriota bacterium]
MSRAPWQREGGESSFLRSALTTENRYQSRAELFEWLRARHAASRFEVRPIAFAEMEQWGFVEGPQHLAHGSGKFFTIEGARVQTNHGPRPAWDQPIIRQPEIGILGIVTRVIDGVRYCLMQAKMEPGNVNTLQLSPTVQATKSNYTRVHEGKRTRYLEYFLEPGRSTVLVDQLQSEHGSYFLRKRNRNMVVEVNEDIPPHDDYCWLTLGELHQLMRRDNLVNMDSRSVLSCIPMVPESWAGHRPAAEGGGERIAVFDQSLSGFRRDIFLSMLCRHDALHSVESILSWITRAKSDYEMQVEPTGLDEVRDWVVTERDIHHATRQRFRVIAVAVEAGSREVVRWSQPLLHHDAHALSGFLAQKIEGVLHFLVRASLKPGNVDGVDVGPTVTCPGYQSVEPELRPPFLDLFVDSPPEWVRYSTVQSEEGGRFHHFQTRHMLVELPPDDRLELPPDFLWMSLGQLAELLRFGHLNLEARSVLSCLSLI